MTALYQDHEDADIRLSDADAANVPINCFVLEPSAETGGRWEWIADNFMPRRGAVMSPAYHITADTRDAILAAVRAHVVPLYEAALQNLTATGVSYYWRRAAD